MIKKIEKFKYSKGKSWYCYEDGLRSGKWKVRLSMEGETIRTSTIGFFKNSEDASEVALGMSDDELIVDEYDDRVEIYTEDDCDFDNELITPATEEVIDDEIGDTSMISELNVASLSESQKHEMINLLNKFKRENSPFKKVMQNILKEVMKKDLSTEEEVSLIATEVSKWIAKELIRAEDEVGFIDIEQELEKLGIFLNISKREIK